jgi:tRNA1Val (adenine37-N6)-methyltransferase
MEDIFHFRQFSLQHRHSAMKVGTDGVLLGAWTNIRNAGTILDVGTGTGLLALMLAQRTHGKARIDAVEIDPLAGMDARANFASSPWPESLRLHIMPVQQFQPEYPYDLIISNPPYFTNSLLSSDPRRNSARHTCSFSHEELIRLAVAWLKPDARLAVILPPSVSARFVEEAACQGLYLNRQCNFRTRIHKPVHRLLMEFSGKPSIVQEEELCLYAGDQLWTNEYKNLTGAFYLRS